ncbi:hypothetical protein B0H14DRAFT_3169823 [Mycena olivaceomarginata]|nr:hypothetical protein B0H14DRAFT_3169823 [Mycena olivaceomarginata]
MSDSYISSSSCIPKRVQRLKARQSRLKGLVTQQPPNSLEYRISMLPPRPPPTFSPPPVPNIPGKESSHSWINKELFIEVRKLKAKCRHLTEALVARKPPNLDLQFLFVDILYFEFVEEYKMQEIAAVELYSSDDRRRSSGPSKSEIALDHWFSHQGAQDYAFLGLPVYQDKPLPLIWEAAETLKFPTFCVYKIGELKVDFAGRFFAFSPEHFSLTSTSSGHITHQSPTTETLMTPGNGERDACGRITQRRVPTIRGLDRRWRCMSQWKQPKVAMMPYYEPALELKRMGRKI